MLNLKRITKKAGLPPGSLVYTGKNDIPAKIVFIEYNKDIFSEETIKECPKIANKDTVKWIKINGLKDVENLKKIGNCFNLHPLVLEDILNTNQRPKVEDYKDYLYIVLKLFDVNDNDLMVTKQVSLILQKNLVISFQDDDEPIFDPIIKRIKTKQNQIINRGADYLLYSLIDTIIDSYFWDLEKVEDNIERIETNLIENTSPEVLKRIHNIKMDIITLRKTIRPLREMLSTLESSEYFQIDKSTDYYLRDVYDHSLQIFEMLESLRDRVSEILDIYLSSTSNKLNEIVRVLTVISTIFVPLTFIVGLYGMNFDNMPELRHPLGYPAVIVIMGIVALFMLAYFRRKKWI
ncbi:magnesium/cobalt transporter CorA [Methanobacterium sp.]|uniref:magnesium/cobalt transporter CorA n=1 Tax=Methanobacterium sp. TaxID=2164 RepID=UPI003C779CED